MDSKRVPEDMRMSSAPLDTCSQAGLPSDLKIALPRYGK